RAKSRALLDIVSGALDLEGSTGPNQNDPAEVKLETEMARLRAELNWRYSQLTEVGKAAEADNLGAACPDAADWHRVIQERERALEALQNRMAATQGVAGLYAPPIDLAATQRLVPPNGALIEYFLAGDQLTAFVLRGDSVHVFRDLVRASELVNLVRRVRFQIDRALVTGAEQASRVSRLLADARRELGSLDAAVLAPLREAVGAAERLVIIPHGPLHAVPFHALWDGQQYLIERAEVLYAPSASLLAHMQREDDAGSFNGALVVGVPDETAPQIAHETRQVAAALGTDNVLLGPSATVERVTAAARGVSIVHLACHGRFSPTSPLMSGIKLADGWLTVRDNYKLRLSRALVTLSACNTGRSVVGSGDELVGLIRSFLAAGASSLVVSLWIVNDESAAAIMTDFYRAWQAGATPSAALRDAQRVMLDRRPHPAFWAPFIMEGSP
ncbi:MAG: CHAT domain-containing protein, partial [Chloroflexota bacterium]|nr:CHAT domain-containing protein [Chloroflexota bacterium]